MGAKYGRKYFKINWRNILRGMFAFCSIVSDLNASNMTNTKNQIEIIENEMGSVVIIKGKRT